MAYSKEYADSQIDIGITRGKDRQPLSQAIKDASLLLYRQDNHDASSIYNLIESFGDMPLPSAIQNAP